MTPMADEGNPMHAPAGSDGGLAVMVVFDHLGQQVWNKVFFNTLL